MGGVFGPTENALLAKIICVGQFRGQCRLVLQGGHHVTVDAPLVDPLLKQIRILTRDSKARDVAGKAACDQRPVQEQFVVAKRNALPARDRNWIPADRLAQII